MLTLLFFYTIHQVALAIGLASSLIADVFLIVVQKTKHIRGIEKNIMNRVLSYSFISAATIFIIQMAYIYFLILTDNTVYYTTSVFTFAIITTLISACLLFTVTSQKYYQINILYRYQEKHQHLSNTFMAHHKELRYTALLSVVLWIALYICYVVR